MVDGGVEPQVLRQPGAFLRTARDTNGAAAQRLGDLTDEDADGTGGGGDCL